MTCQAISFIYYYAVLTIFFFNLKFCTPKNFAPWATAAWPPRYATDAFPTPSHGSDHQIPFCVKSGTSTTIKFTTIIQIVSFNNNRQYKMFIANCAPGLPFYRQLQHYDGNHITSYKQMQFHVICCHILKKLSHTT